MKTRKELAKEYADRCKLLSDFPHDWNSDYSGYIAGYKEATRWRDPEVEKPENVEPVIVKYMTARGIKKYGIAKYFELGIGNPWTIEGSTGRKVIGWRPIE